MSHVRTFSALAVACLLGFAVLADLSIITMGGMTADAYYLPLRAVPVGGQREEIEGIIRSTHGRLVRYQRRLWLVIHGSTLAASLVVLATGKAGPEGPIHGRQPLAGSKDLV